MSSNTSKLAERALPGWVLNTRLFGSFPPQQFWFFESWVVDRAETVPAVSTKTETAPVRLISPTFPAPAVQSFITQAG